MASVNQTLPHCVNQIGKKHSKPLAARHGRGTAWARHAMCESALSDLFNLSERTVEHKVNNIRNYVYDLDETAIKHLKKKAGKVIMEKLTSQF